MNGVSNSALFRHFYLEYPQPFQEVSSDAVRRKSVRSAISATASRKSDVGDRP